MSRAYFHKWTKNWIKSIKLGFLKKSTQTLIHFRNTINLSGFKLTLQHFQKRKTIFNINFVSLKPDGLIVFLIWINVCVGFFKKILVYDNLLSVSFYYFHISAWLNIYVSQSLNISNFFNPEINCSIPYKAVVCW